MRLSAAEKYEIIQTATEKNDLLKNFLRANRIIRM